MHTYPLADSMRHIEAGRWSEVGGMLLSSAERLRRAGAQLLICPDNTAHQGLDLVHNQSPVPWLHIAEEVAAVASRHRFRRVLVLGTRYLMEGPVYPTKLDAVGIAHEIPDAPTRAQIDALTFDELFLWPARGHHTRLLRRRDRAVQAARVRCGRAGVHGVPTTRE